MKKPPRILAIAGSDSSGGAGIQADIKTITMLGGYAMTAITAVTAQNTLGVHAVETHSADFVGAQIDACLSDIGVDAVKIGMLGSPEIANVVASQLEKLDIPIVFDPVMVATSGSVLADKDTIVAFERLMKIATLTTPNIAELAALSGDVTMARRGVAYLAKGGDTDSDQAIDRLVRPRRSEVIWSASKIETRHTHGTGCTLSSAIATFLGFGLELEDAVARAREFVRLALHDAPGFGAQSGPLGHQAVRMDLTGEPRLNQITLAVGNYEEAVLFYRAIGLAQMVDSPSNGYARFESPGGTTLSVSTGHGEVGGASVYFECLDVDAFTDTLRERGIACLAPEDQSWNWRESWATDPSGNRICFYQAGEDRRYPPWRIG
ncbi:bifunctional hydroxymethylpyrimidine kinase/phosphomethylpyrimidine kinase [Pontixanthobacter aestiaquae]|uniref:hydroxymethylpyrimidine kinase n=1 Tax=Pontixanthobacter aestiaquae TaxID=1509367 RepID=A0A844Z6Q4_9SPHN|nr:bifunctional hydroxymethylpyrimidine kinase/phosphomethylpyrimidine kinase [Pontixanthobacter aestiaquae]MDN3646469.1 bifunctional hydroxymethylpyrimidine kinase/phosphomethylpyrimidine kinase [Pontixanthobacter aestiaquae]MXO82543.1 bifunctional hydroxymethylpyrimidine kinase/phosphomethylpyrimidine kinase [Pontixanthobacter aestiaquae]